MRLFSDYFSEQKAIDEIQILLESITRVGLDGHEAKEVLETGRYANDVKSLETQWIGRGVRAVPTIIFNEQHWISGAQSSDVFKAQIEQLALTAA